VRLRPLALACLAAFLTTACWPEIGPPTAPAASQAESEAYPLLVLAAADLQFALQQIADQYERERQRKVTLTFGSTGNLSQQIENGAPADLFFAADESFLAGLERKGLVVEGTRGLYAVGRIVIAPAKTAPFGAKTLQDLLQPEVKKVAIANPEHAPYGAAAKQALRAAQVWERVEPKLVLGENIAQTFQFVQTGNAEAGIVALSVVLGVPGTSYTLIDQALHLPLRQAAGVIATSKQPEVAREFLAFVNGPSGRPIMKQYGFLLPEEL
jgi:molybdate transport system substrate-binding protein